LQQLPDRIYSLALGVALILKRRISIISNRIYSLALRPPPAALISFLLTIGFVTYSSRLAEKAAWRINQAAIFIFLKSFN
jgi:hypothetical protein